MKNLSLSKGIKDNNNIVLVCFFCLCVFFVEGSGESKSFGLTKAEMNSV